MCVIVIKKKGVRFDRNDLAACFMANDHGVGVSWHEHGMLHVRKALPETISDLFDFVDQVHTATTKDVDSVWHFRIATSGGENTAAKSHPFMLHDDLSKVTEMITELKQGAVVYHNGILNAALPKEDEALLSQYIDTQLFIAHRMVPIIKKHNGLNLAAYNEISAMLSGSKLAVHLANGALVDFGYFTEVFGLRVSNEYWLNRKGTLLRQYERDLDKASRWYGGYSGTSYSAGYDDYGYQKRTGYRDKSGNWVTYDSWKKEDNKNQKTKPHSSIYEEPANDKKADVKKEKEKFDDAFAGNWDEREEQLLIEADAGKTTDPKDPFHVAPDGTIIDEGTGYCGF